MPAPSPDQQAANDHRVRYAELFDAELRPHNERFRAAAAVQPGDRVLDIGCGTGETTREAGLAAVDGSAHGVDVSAPAVEHARKLADGLDNVSFEVADAQTHAFPTGAFDLCISRFGTIVLRRSRCRLRQYPHGAASRRATGAAGLATPGVQRVGDRGP